MSILTDLNNIKSSLGNCIPTRRVNHTVKNSQPTFLQLFEKHGSSRRAHLDITGQGLVLVRFSLEVPLEEQMPSLWQRYEIFYIYAYLFSSIQLTHICRKCTKIHTPTVLRWETYLMLKYNVKVGNMKISFKISPKHDAKKFTTIRWWYLVQTFGAPVKPYTGKALNNEK